ncbi:TPA_asm: hypothetical protein [Altiarchaeum virus]|nr:TPA_asm: hypothetical protein [Altiarchaeum virus]
MANILGGANAPKVDAKVGETAKVVAKVVENKVETNKIVVDGVIVEFTQAELERTNLIQRAIAQRTKDDDGEIIITVREFNKANCTKGVIAVVANGSLIHMFVTKDYVSMEELRSKIGVDVTRNVPGKDSFATCLLKKDYKKLAGVVF